MGEAGGMVNGRWFMKTNDRRNGAIPRTTWGIAPYKRTKTGAEIRLARDGKL